MEQPEQPELYASAEGQSYLIDIRRQYHALRLAVIAYRRRYGLPNLEGAPSSTKNRERARDPEMHQTRKGRQWFFGMKLHSGTDARTGLVHSVSTTAANVSDVTEAHRLLHGGESAVWGDAGYQGVEKRPEHAGSECAGRWRCARVSGGSCRRAALRHRRSGGRPRCVRRLSIRFST